MTELSDPKTYFEFISSLPVTLVHFWANWNAYDIQMKKRLEEIEPFFLINVGFGSVDVDQERMWSICKDIKIRTVPTLVFYRKGEVVEVVIGLTQSIKEKLNCLIAEQ
jgi:thioredoxin-like negative regulator of GroEL